MRDQGGTQGCSPIEVSSLQKRVRPREQEGNLGGDQGDSSHMGPCGAGRERGDPGPGPGPTSGPRRRGAGRGVRSAASVAPQT